LVHNSNMEDKEILESCANKDHKIITLSQQKLN